MLLERDEPVEHREPPPREGLAVAGVRVHAQPRHRRIALALAHLAEEQEARALPVGQVAPEHRVEDAEGRDEEGDADRDDGGERRRHERPAREAARDVGGLVEESRGGHDGLVVAGMAGLRVSGRRQHPAAPRAAQPPEDEARIKAS